jgi:hypothetical protein
VTDFWNKPQDYAKFLAEELGFVYKERLLVVMPEGYGYWDIGQSGLPERRSLSELDPPRRTSKLLASAMAAVRQLAAREGVRLSVPDVDPPPEGMSNSQGESTPGHTPQPTATAEASAAPPGAEDTGGGVPDAVLFFSPFGVAGLVAVGLIVVRRRRDDSTRATAPTTEAKPKPLTTAPATLSLPKATTATLSHGLAVPVKVPAAGRVAITLSASGRWIASGSADAERAGNVTVRLPKIPKAEKFRGKALSLKLTFGDTVVTKTLKVR